MEALWMFTLFLKFIHVKIKFIQSANQIQITNVVL